MSSSNSTGALLLFIMGALLLSTMGSSVSAQPSLKDIDQLLGVMGSRQIELDIPDEVDGFLEVAVPIEDKIVLLQLLPRSVRDADFMIQSTDANGNTIFTDPGPVRTFRGTVANHKGSDVAGALHIEGLWAHIVLPNGTSYWIEPLAERFTGFSRNDHVVYRGDQVLPSNGLCGVIEGAQGSPTPGLMGGTGCNGDFCIAAIAIDADFAFFTNYFSSEIRTANRIELVINIVNQQYERDVQISHRIISPMVIRTSQATPPLYFNDGTNNSANNLLAQLNAEWQANQSNVGRDLVHLFTGLTGFQGVDGNGNLVNVIGVATVGSVCDITSHYGWSESDFSQNLSLCTNLTAHELGHSWSAPATHCNPACTNPPFTMDATINGGNQFTATTINTIQTFRDTLSCLQPGVINDRCEDAISICSGTYSGTTVGAFQDGFADCDINPSPDVWYSFTPSANGNVTFSISSTNMPNVGLSVHDGCPGGTFNQLACDIASNNPTVTVPLLAGEPVLIRVAAPIGIPGIFSITVGGPACAPPINNPCFSPIDICPGGFIGSTEGSTYDATGSCGSSNGSPDVWFRYTPLGNPVNDLMVIDTCYSEFDTILEVYNALTPAGDPVCPNNLGAPLICSNNNVCGSGDQLTLPVNAGNSFLIRVSGVGGATGSFRLSLSGPQCINDVCTSATVIEDGTHLGTLDGAAYDTGGENCSNGIDDNFDGLIDCADPVCSTNSACGGADLCGQSDNTPDVFYSYTATCNGIFFANTCGSNDLHGQDSGLDSVLSIHNGCPADSSTLLPSLSCNDDSFGNFSCSGLDLGAQRDSFVATPIQAGDTFIIRVSHWGGPSGFPDQFILNVGVIPENDDCADAIDVSSGGSFTGDTRCATADGLTNCAPTDKDVWYQFTASCNGTLQVDTCGSNDLGGTDNGTDTVLSLHDSCPGTDLNTLECNDDYLVSDNTTICNGIDQGDRRDSYVSRELITGETVIIRVSNYSGAAPNNGPGVFNLNVNFVEDFAPPHSLRNGDFSASGDHWCFDNQNSSGFRLFENGAAQVFSADADEGIIFSHNFQRFTTFDVVSHRVSFDWFWFPSGANDDQPRWDLIDADTGLSVVDGPHVLSTFPTQDAGSVNMPFSGSGPFSGDYILQCGAYTQNGLGGPGVAAFDNFEINCDLPPGPLTNGDFSDSTGEPWCFTDRTENGSVDFSSGAAAVTAGDDGEGASSFISQLINLPAGILELNFDWSLSSPGNDSDLAFYQLLDPNGDLVNGNPFLSGTDGESATESLIFDSPGGNYRLNMGTLSPNDLGEPGETTFDNVSFNPATCEGVTDLVCTESAVAMQLDWTNNDTYSEIQIFSDLDGLIGTVAGDQTTFFDNFPAPEPTTYWVVGVCGPLEAPPSNTCGTSECPRVEPLSCTVSNSQVTLTWSNPVNYTAIRIQFGTLVIETLIGSATQYVSDPLPDGTWSFCVVGLCGSTEADATCCDVIIGEPEPEFIRGDCNQDGSIDIGDVIGYLTHLFGGAPLPGSCEDACDSNDDGQLNIGDGIYVLTFLFSSGDSPPPPYPGCGPDPTPDALDCVDYPNCP